MPTAKINGKEYPVEVRNGEPYINNQTVDEFMKTLPFEDIAHFAELGLRMMNGEQTYPQEDITDMEFRDY